MANWAYIENNQIKEVFDELPKNWKNVSNLDALENNVEALKNLGWYPIQHNYIDYDPKVQNLRSLNINYDGNSVYEFLIAEDIDTTVLYNEFMLELRQERNKLLQESDFMCLFDLIQNKGIEYATDVTTYRQNLRDLPTVYTINNFPSSILQVVWPIKPNLNDYPNITNKDPESGGVI